MIRLSEHEIAARGGKLRLDEDRTFTPSAAHESTPFVTDRLSVESAGGDGQDSMRRFVQWLGVGIPSSSPLNGVNTLGTNMPEKADM